MNQPEQVRYRARLPPISVESLPIQSMILMTRSATPDVLIVHIRLVHRPHGWTVLAYSRPTTHLRSSWCTAQLDGSEVCFSLSIRTSYRQPSRLTVLDPVSIAS